MIRIVTDSTCEAPPELLAHPMVTVIPLYVLFGDEALRDEIDISKDEFWARLPTSDPLPTTTQPTPAEFLSIFQQLTDAGDEVIAILISRRLSGTYDSAAIARESNENWPVEVVNSGSVSVGLGLMVQRAVEMVETGASRTEIVAAMDRMRDGIQLMFTVETLEYLQRGGRIGKAQAMVGTVLRLKPLLGISDGEVVPFARVRSKRKALGAMLDLLADQVSQRGPGVRLAITHAGVPDEAAEVGQALATRFASAPPYISSLGPVVGTHVGPGTIGAAVHGAD